MPSLFVLLKAAHVVGAIWLMGPGFGYGVISVMGHQQPEHRAFAAQVIGRLSKRMFTPGLILVIASGIGMGLIAPSFYTQGWLITCLVIIAIVLAYSYTIHRSDQQEVRRLAPRLAQGPTPEAIARIGFLRKRLHLAGRCIAYSYGIVAILMVLRPF